MERKVILPPALIEQLRRHLYEVNFVYKRLPGVLQRAGLASSVQRWGSYFMEQVGILKDQRTELENLIVFWGERPRPCACPEVDELLNELQHVLASRHALSSMEDRVLEVSLSLQRIVVSRLEEGVELARRLGERELVERLQNMFMMENDRHTSMPGVGPS